MSIPEVTQETCESPKSVEITAENIKAIIHSTIRLEAGALTLLKGGNGVGKTTFQKAITGMLGRSGKGLEPRDNVSAGTLEMPGVRVRISKRMSITGEPGETLVLLEDGDEIKNFVDPGIAKPSSADQKRIESLLKMSGTKIDSSVFVAFVGEEDWKAFCEMVDIESDGPVERVAKMKRWLDAKGKTAEVEVEQTTGAIANIGEIPPPPDTTVDVPALTKSHSDLIVKIATAKEAIRGAEKAKEGLSKLSEVTGDPVEIDKEQTLLRSKIEEIRADIDPIKAAAESQQEQLKNNRDAMIADINEKYAAASQEILSKLNLEVSTRQSEIAAIESTADALKEKHRELVKFIETRDQLTASVKTEWTAEAVSQMQSEVDEIAKRLAAAAVSKEAASSRDAKVESLDRLTRKKATLVERAKRYRGLADKTPSILSGAVKNLPGWSIVNHAGDIRLMCEHERGTICFDELSPGEAIARALDVRSQQQKASSGQIPVVSLPAELLAALEGTAKQQLLKDIHDRGICVLSSRCSELGEPRELHSVVMRHDPQTES